MRVAVLIVLLALAGNCEAADWADWLLRKDTFGEWLVVDRKKGFDVYANAGTIRNSGGIAKMWELTDFGDDKGALSGKGPMSLKTERDYDCNRQHWRTIYIARHSKNMGEGSILSSDSIDGSWQPVAAGTIGERLWRIACNRR